ncbi:MULTISPECIES: gamma-glutamyltransferase [unclassified Mesorhizobium]|uniref:gamma-glutamyltransferase n=1 Tax=unclassified Mesorhizobium TaxID=325217 RepID=UPI0018CB3D17|nr:MULTISPECIES: gamma-glutamyltransferase [unclassified Mesorhizobium]
MGHRACTVPSTPAAFDHVWRNYGLLRHTRVMRSATGAVGGGRPVARLHHQQTQRVMNYLRSPATKDLFLHKDQSPNICGMFRDPEFAATLRRQALIGIAGF